MELTAVRSETDVWADYKATGSTELRNQLVLQYSPLVKYVAGRVRSELPANVDSADLVSEGVIGLIDAIDKYEPERGLQFQTYAVPRIRGAILDSIRAADWVLSETLLRDGRAAGLATINATLRPVGVRAVTPDLFTPVPGGATPDGFDPIRYLVRHGFSQRTTYQPAARFWRFQAIEAAWLLALSLLLLGATVRLVARQTAASGVLRAWPISWRTRSAGSRTL